MRMSQLFLPTLREVPGDAELISHQYMLRAGMIRKIASGIYTWLPLGLRVLRKVERIVREEMDMSGSQEITMPSIQPAELWQESGRWEQYGPELLRVQDRHQRDFCVGPTHEEVITQVIRQEINSYKQLPLSVYQIQNKFRDEIRPRFGVMRAREFLMKDAYTFNLDQASLEQSYQIMHAAYTRIFTRLGLKFRVVDADGGSIGGSRSQEFQVLADSGEDIVVHSDTSKYAANIELAEALAPQGARPAPGATMQSVDTPAQRTIDDVCQFLELSPQQSIKTLLVKGTEQPIIALLLRGDHQLNPIKAEKLDAIAAPLTFADEADIVATLKCHPGSIGPVDLALPIIADREVAHLADFVCGANEDDKHLINVNWERDLPLCDIADLRNVVAGDPSPDGKGKLQLTRGIEVGHIFQLGQKYSAAMGAKVLNESGKQVTLEMGSYGIGISRIVAAAIEQNHDEHGIIWPLQMAPFEIAIVPINMHKSKKLQKACDKLYEKLVWQDKHVLLDDRKERPGVLFADMDLIGIPHRIVMSERGLEQGTVEYKGRTDKESQEVPLDNISAFLANIALEAMV